MCWWRGLLAIAVSIASSSCAIQRAEIANTAPSRMIGLSKEQVLGCMGPPGNKAAEGATEVWSYASGNNFSTASYGNGFAVGSSRFCTVNVTMTSGYVSAINYVGPTGGLLSPNEQCAFAAANCVR
jgi:hypothetical protein